MLAGALLTTALYGGARAFEGACRGELEGFRTLAAARASARAAEATGTAEGGAAGQAPPGAGLVAGALDVVLAVKQSDGVAFPAHAVAATAVELAGCPDEAVGVQWRKAASHAWAELPARVAAEGLARSVGAAAPEALRAYAEAEPWHGENLARVERAYRELR